jgi:hypothetical protein
MLHFLIPVFVAGGAAGLASFALPLPGAVAVALMVSNVVSEFLRSNRVQEPMSWPRALTKGLVAGTIAFLVLSLLNRR